MAGKSGQVVREFVIDIEKNHDESEAYKPERMARTTTKLKSKAESLTVLEARRSTQH